MKPVVIDASAGAEMVGRTRRGQALARLLPTDAVGWVPEHFDAEVASVPRRQLLVEARISEAQASEALTRLRDWRLRSVGVRPLLDDAWGYHHNMTAADGLYVALAEHLGAQFLT